MDVTYGSVTKMTISALMVFNFRPRKWDESHIYCKMGMGEIIVLPIISKYILFTFFHTV